MSDTFSGLNVYLEVLITQETKPDCGLFKGLCRPRKHEMAVEDHLEMKKMGVVS